MDLKTAIKSIDQDEFFEKIGLDPKNLTDEQKQQIATDFLGYFLLRTLRDFSTVAEAFEDYLEDFRANYKPES